MMKIPACTLAAILAAATTTPCVHGFLAPQSSVAGPSQLSQSLQSSHPSRSSRSIKRSRSVFRLAATEGDSSAGTSDSSDAVFVADKDEGSASEEDDKTFEAVEKMGKGAAKTKRGKRKGGDSTPSTTSKASATLTPETTFYEGPPAITETIAPTISILTVVGIIPAAAAWARQAWVRYTITNRRIRVTSGVGGKDMAEIVYPDVVEIRTVKRLFGDGDMVFFLRDGAKFEMRNVPNFEETIEFILGQVDAGVRETYRSRGDVSKN